MSPLSAFPLQGEQTFSTITRNALQIRPLTYFTQTAPWVSCSAWFTRTHNGTCSTFLFTSWGTTRLPSSSLWSDARDLLSKNHLDDFSSELRGHTEMGRRWKVFQSIPYHSSAAEPCRLPDRTQTLQARYCGAPQSLTNHASFSVLQLFDVHWSLLQSRSCSYAHHTSALSHSFQILSVFPGSVHRPPVSMALSIVLSLTAQIIEITANPSEKASLHQQRLLKSKNLKCFGIFYHSIFFQAFLATMHTRKETLHCNLDKYTQLVSSLI